MIVVEAMFVAEGMVVGIVAVVAGAKIDDVVHDALE